ncbi:hypothetical protein NEF87_003167 [Candidatus Lokiarchaeum ossiferum]|uniref:magnesium chelatase n=1 Tax=Candidatus Lokiarchaeum ossiferum TaxID=2951803 RepID=A0ABY6HX10_9ARCH|nr:hypothetical protein NEF87_003167 [Candidatus Lokiarchaeum sp. B-35]
MTQISTSESSFKPVISLITASVSLQWLTEGLAEINATYGYNISLYIYMVQDINKEKISQDKFRSAISNSDVLLLDIRGYCLAVEILEEELSRMETSDPERYENMQVITIVAGSPRLMRLTKLGHFRGKMIPASNSSKKDQELNFDEFPDITDAVRKGKKMDAILGVFSKLFPFKALRDIRNWVYFRQYWINGLAGIPINHKNLILFLLKSYMGYSNLKVSLPALIPEQGIYHPIENQYYDSLPQFLKKHPLDANKQTIGLFFYGGLYFEQSLPIIREFFIRFEEYNIIPVFSDVLQNVEAHRNYFFRKRQCIVDIVLNFQYFQLNGGPLGGDSKITLDLYREMNVPHITPVIQFDLLLNDYLESDQGTIPINQIISVVMPELDGKIEMMTVGCMYSHGYSDLIHNEILKIIPLLPNIELIGARVKKWLKLRKLANAEKKVAVMIYNYPPGEDKLGNAAYLDVSASLTNLVPTLIKEGYSTTSFLENIHLSDLFFQNGAINKAKYLNRSHFFGVKLPIGTYLKYFQQLPLQFQQEITDYWGAPPGNINIIENHIQLPILIFGNIIIALQPARTLVKGDAEDYHNQKIPPHHQYLALYYYLEHLLKINALIHFGTHGTLEFMPGKQNLGCSDDYGIHLIGTLPHLYYYHITNTSEAAIAKRRSNAVVINHAGPSFKPSGLYQEFAQIEKFIAEYHELSSMQQNSGDSASLEKLQILEEEIKTSIAHLPIEYSSISALEEQIYQYKTQVIPMGLHILGQDLNFEELSDMIAQILLHSGSISHEIFPQEAIDSDEKVQNTILLNKIQDLLTKFYSNHQYHLSVSDTDIDFPLIRWLGEFLDQYWQSCEMKNLLRGLSGEFIEPGLGGDPIRDPSIYPTGRNSYGFDPRLIPSTTAFRRGKEITGKILSNYYQSNHTYPESTSVVLWAFETMKTGGETISQILHYLGVKPVKKSSIWTTELEVIPRDEMTHPRINVLVTICGIFRDTFPNLVNLLNEAFELVAHLDEPTDFNFVRKLFLEQKLDGTGCPIARVFGPAPGKYNTNLTTMISAGTWSEETELVDDYINSMSFTYQKNQVVSQQKKAFIHSLKKLDVISQVRDSTEYHITDLDHYYEFAGGLSRSAEEVQKKKIPTLIADTTSKEIRLDTLQSTVLEGSITRSLNPKWIKGMLAHPFHGGQKVAERLENVLGLSATTDSVNSQIWNRYYSQYIDNEEIKSALVENNHFAMMSMIKDFLQAHRRSYWEATSEQLENLKRLYLELENWVEQY